MATLKIFFKYINPIDLIVIVFYILLTILTLVYSSIVDEWLLLIGYNFLLFIFIFWISGKANRSRNKYWMIAHYYYVIPLIFLTFKEVYVLLSAIRTIDYDHLLISIDRFIFGIDPTVYLYQFSHPILTEIMQIAYATFFLLPIILGVEFQKKNDYNTFNFIIFTVVLGFFLSYIGYFLLPAVGPRFTLHDFDAQNIELPGIFITNFLREIVNIGESIPNGTINPIEVVQRDVFPSGHTQMTLIIMYLAVKLKSKNKIFFLVDGTLLIISTVYLRYHYVIDLIGGFAFMILTMAIAKPIFNWWQKRNGKEEFSYNNHN
jgi:membrane-associated phospholipid phosphatase